MTNIICKLANAQNRTINLELSQAVYAWWHVPEAFAIDARENTLIHYVPSKSYRCFRRKRAIVIQIVKEGDLYE
jgi:hypothetical protein